MTNEENPVIQAAKKYQQDSAQYVTMRQIGKVLKVSSHVVGQKLKDVGLRDALGHPTEKAREGGFTKPVLFQERFALDLWHLDKALAILRPLIEQKK